jgi:hypothetical protein
VYGFAATLLLGGLGVEDQQNNNNNNNNNILLTAIGLSPDGSGYLTYVYTKHETGLLLNLRREGYMISR